MTRIARLKQLLNQNIVARLVLYAAALLMPVAAYFNINTNAYAGSFDKIGFHNVMWVGFYSCMLLLWACNKKRWERVINVIILMLNLLPVVLLCLEVSVVGFWGIIGVIVLTIFPFFNFGGDWGLLIRCAVFFAIVGLVLYLNGDWQERWAGTGEE